MINNPTKFKQTELGLIPEDWEILKLDDVCFPVSDTYNLSVKEEIVFLNSGDIFDGKVLNHEKISTKGLPGQAKKRISKGDILFSEIRPANKRYAFIDFDADDYVVSTKLMVLKPKGNISIKYLLTYLSSPEILNDLQIIAESRSGTFPQITFDAIKSTPILMPPIQEQNRVAEVLGALDEKIELNRKMNKTLESLAETIFKKWFIDDADPNWEYGFLGDLVGDIVSGDWGKEASENNFSNEVVCIRGADVPEIKKSDCGKPPVRFVKDNQQKLLRYGDIVIECSGGTSTQQTGRSVLIIDQVLERFDHPLICSNFCKILRVSGIANAPFVISVLNNIYSNDEIYQFESGTTGIKNLNLESLLKSYRICIPSTDTLKRFSKAYLDLYEQIQQNGKENLLLSQIRDSLLPRLMSGKLRVR